MTDLEDKLAAAVEAELQTPTLEAVLVEPPPERPTIQEIIDSRWPMATRVVARALCKAHECTLCVNNPKLCQAPAFYRAETEAVVYALTRARLLKGT